MKEDVNESFLILYFIQVCKSLFDNSGLKALLNKLEKAAWQNSQV